MCLRCNTMQQNLSSHLKQKCLKDDSQQNRQQELQSAKDSQKNWNRTCRILDFTEFEKFLRPGETLNFCEKLESKGFVLLNKPQ